jgi:tol-pal system protein YbgF
MQKWTNKKIWLVTIAFGLTGNLMVHTAWAADTKLSNTEIVQKFEQIDKELVSIKNKLNAVITLANNTARQVASRSAADSIQKILLQETDRLQQSITSIQLNLKNLNSEIAQLQNRLLITEKRAKYADSINFEILSQLVILENRIVSLNNSMSELNSLPAKETSPSVGSPTPSSYRERYLNALTLHQNGKHESAAEQFRRLISEDRNHDLADNAQYWLGECYYSMKQYQRAIIEFEKVRSFTNSDKADDAQFKLGLCYRQMGDLEKARKEFLTLIATYPQSEFVENAKQLLK